MDTDLDGNKYRFFKDSLENGKVEFYQNDGSSWPAQELGINLKDGGSSWYAYEKGVANNKLSLAKLSEEAIIDNGQNEEELVEAIIPDGDYIIADKDGRNAMTIRKASLNQANASSIDENDSLKNIRKNLPTDSVIYNIENNLDGTYTITGDGTKLRIKNDGNSNGYSELDLNNNAEPVKIATLKENPNLFYIYNEIGSVQFDGSKWRSKLGELGEPLRLYKVTNNDEDNNKRFTHQENTPTEKLANIPNGNYVIGNSPNINDDFTDPQDPNHENFDNEQIINTLPGSGVGGWNSVKAWIHYNEKATNGNMEYHTIEERVNNTLAEWEFIQTDQPGHYYVKNQEGEYLYIGGGAISKLQGINEDFKKLIIYKDEEKVDQVLITQGNYRLRFDQTENKWKVVSNSEPLTNADYHYIGKKSNDYLNFNLTNPEEVTGNNWLNNVRLMEKILVDNLDNNLGTNMPKGSYSLGTNIPKGYYKELGPIGKIYNIQHSGEENPYKNLYRMGQKKDGLPSNLTEDLLKDHYKEYDLIGWEITLDGTNYLIDKDAEFTKKTDGSGIEISGDKVSVNGVVQTENLFISYGNKNPLTTKWRELSAPLYFEFNYGKGIMDLERAMSVKDLLTRETSNDIVTPVVAIGRLFYGQDLSEDKGSISSITINDKLKRKFRSDRSLVFDGDTTANDERLINQIYIEKIVDIGSGKDPTFKTPGFTITDARLRQDSIDWLRESDTVLAILKKSIDNNDFVDFQPDKKNIKIDNYDIDFLWIDRQANGSYLKGIVYANMTDLTIEKQFENIDEKDIEKLKGEYKPENDSNSQERFNIQMKVDSKRGDPQDENRQYNDTLYTLAFNRTSDGNTNQTDYPILGEGPKRYNDIQRVNTVFDNEIVKWRARVFKDEFFQLEERNVDLKDYEGGAEKNLYSRIKPYKKSGENPEIQIDSFSYATSKLASIKSPREGAYKTEDYDLVNFDNLYSTGGVIFLHKKDKSGNPLKGITFELDKISGDSDDSKFPQTEETLEDGSLIFTDLLAGKYRLKEVSSGDIYQKIDPFEFSIKEDAGRPPVGKPSYFIEEFNTASVKSRAGKYEDGDRSINYIDVTNEIKSDIKALRVEKDFENLTTAEFEDIIKGDSQGMNFQINIEGIEAGKKYTKTLTYDNANSVISNSKKLIWYVTGLEGTNGEISPLDMEEISISEDNEEYFNYPIVRRVAKFNGENKDFSDFPNFKIENSELSNEGDNVFQLINIYTDTFELALQVEGRTKEYKDYRAIKGMQFSIYGSIDEVLPGNPLELLKNTNYYKLEKPDHDGELTDIFETNLNGIERIDKLSYYEGNEYALNQEYNPPNGNDEVFQNILEPFIIQVVKNNEGKLEPKILSGHPLDEQIEWEYQNGILVLRIKLDRTNYRLPETGGIGTNIVKKVAIGIIFATVTSLIYRKKYKNIKTKREN